MSAPKFDWAKIEHEYVCGNDSTRTLAKKYGASESVLKENCAKWNWVKKRKEYRAACLQKATQKAQHREANRLAKLMTATGKAIDAATAALDDQKQFNRYIITEMSGGDTIVSERLYDKVDTKALRDLTVVLKDLTGLMRDFYNIPTPAQAEAQRIAAERLRLEQQKAGGDAKDTEIQIILGDGVEDLAR